VPAPPQAPEVAAAAAPERVKGGRRLDVILFRLGLAFMIIGVVLFFLQGGASMPWPLSAPTPVPSAPPSKPAASPSPAAWLDGSMPGLDRVILGR
jgi:hypothetical protein